MPALTALARDDRSARVLLSMIDAPGNVTTGNLLAEVGAAELISIAEGDGTVPGMDRVEAAVWRDRLLSAATPDRLVERIVEASADIRTDRRFRRKMILQRDRRRQHRQRHAGSLR